VQILIKIIITICVIIAIIAILVFVYSLISFLFRTWHSEIDVKETVRRWFTRKPSGADVIVTRDPKKIYQDGKDVGDVTGQIKTIDNSFTFQQVSNTAELNKNLPFEYQGKKLKIVKVGKEIKIKIGTPTRMNVLEDVVCEMVR